MVSIHVCGVDDVCDVYGVDDLCGVYGVCHVCGVCTMDGWGFTRKREAPLVF